MTYEKMDKNYFSPFIDQNFNTLFVQSGKGLSQLWLQDGDPLKTGKQHARLWVVVILNYYKYHHKVQT